MQLRMPAARRRRRCCNWIDHYHFPRDLLIFGLLSLYSARPFINHSSSAQDSDLSQLWRNNLFYDWWHCWHGASVSTVCGPPPPIGGLEIIGTMTGDLTSDATTFAGRVLKILKLKFILLPGGLFSSVRKQRVLCNVALALKSSY